MSSSDQTQISSADLVGGNEGLISEILFRLPPKSVGRFKLVSKRWSSLISDRSFLCGYNQRNSSTISGLIIGYLVRKPSTLTYTCVSLGENEGSLSVPTKCIPSDPQAPGCIKVLSSCNGLLLCFSRHNVDPAACKLYVFNPTTHQFSTLPLPPAQDKCCHPSFSLVYDPSKSPSYLVVCVQFLEQFCNILIYSSEVGVWETSRSQAPDPVYMRFYRGVFLNGAIHWVSHNGYPCLLDLDRKCFKMLPRPPLPKDWAGCCSFKYFGESQGSLYFIAFDRPRSSKFIVYEMQKDCSGWFAKYSLEVDAILAAFPIDDHPVLILPHKLHLLISMLSLVEVKNEGLNLVMHIPGKVVSYCFKDNTFKKLLDLHFTLPVSWFNAFKYVETLSSI
ncbi:hypothetical protein SLE2022_158450 [Rubroshorea leprosula]